MQQNIDYSKLTKPLVDADFDNIKISLSEIFFKQVDSYDHNIILRNIPFYIKTEDQKNFFHLLFEGSGKDFERRNILTFYLEQEYSYKSKEQLLDLFKAKDLGGKTPVDYLFRSGNEDTIVALLQNLSKLRGGDLEEVFGENIKQLKDDKSNGKNISPVQDFVIIEYERSLESYRRNIGLSKSGDVNRLSRYASSRLSGVFEDQFPSDEVKAGCCINFSKTSSTQR